MSNILFGVMDEEVGTLSLAISQFFLRFKSSLR